MIIKCSKYLLQQSEYENIRISLIILGKGTDACGELSHQLREGQLCAVGEGRYHEVDHHLHHDNDESQGRMSRRQWWPSCCQ